MKTRLLIITGIIGLFVIAYPQSVVGFCLENEDWPDAPCYACPTCYPGIEEEKNDWEPYYDFKGKQFMESKLRQLQTAINDHMLREWFDKSPKPQEHENVHNYYFLNGLAPNHNGMYFDQVIEMEKIDQLSEETNYGFIDFSYANKIGDPIQFILEKIAYDNCNSYDAKITDEDGNLVWGEGAEALCDPKENSSLVTSYIKIGYNEDHPIIINESGKYFIEIEIDNIFTKREFVVRQNHTGVTLDRTVYPILSPLKQIKNGIALIDVQCSEGKHAVYKYNRMRVACVSEETQNELWLRGWATMRLIMPGENISHALCNNYEGKWHPEYEGCRGNITDLQCSLMGGEFVDDLKICYDEICPVDKTYTLCVTNPDLISGEIENEN